MQATLDHKKALLYHRALEVALCERSLYDYIKAAWPVVVPGDKFQDGWHIQCIAEHLEAVMLGQIRNLVINVPPGTTKSLTVNVFWPSQVWATKPTTSFLCAAAGEDLVIRDSDKCRLLISSEWYQERWGHVYQLSKSQNAKRWFGNTKTGYRNTTTVGSLVVGRKGDILVIDDPNDPKRIQSEADRHNTIKWYSDSFYNRVNNPKTGKRVMIGQRTGEGDLCGYVLKLIAEGKIPDAVQLYIPEEHVTSPGKRVTNLFGGWQDPRQEEGEFLRPTRFGPEEKEEAIGLMGQAGYLSQHQQDPQPAGGSQYLEEWLQNRYKFDEKAGKVRTGDLLWDMRQLRIFLTVDHASTVKQTAKHDPDFTAISVWGITPTPNWYLLWLDLDHFRSLQPQIVPAIEDRYNTWKASHAAIETGGTQQGLAQWVQQLTKIVVKGYDPRHYGDKLQRAHRSLRLAEGGKLWLPQEDTHHSNWKRPWLNLALNELLRFSGDDKQGHDDIADTLSWAGIDMGEAPQIGAPGGVLHGGKRGARPAAKDLPQIVAESSSSVSAQRTVF